MQESVELKSDKNQLTSTLFGDSRNVAVVLIIDHFFVQR